VGLSIILLMTPAAYHCIVERGEETKRFHHFGSMVLLWSLVPLALGMSGDVYVVARKVTESGTVSALVATLTLILLYGLWFGFALLQRRRHPQDQMSLAYSPAPGRNAREQRRH